MWRPQFYLSLLVLLGGLLEFDLSRGNGHGPQIFRDLAGPWIDSPWSFRIQSVCFVVAFYLALRTLLRDGQKIVINFLIVALCLGSLSVTTYNLFQGSRTLHLFLYESYRGKEKALRGLSSACLDESQSPESRKKSASGAYRVFRVQLVYREAAGNLVPYMPTEEDVRVRQDLEKGDDTYEAAFAEIDGKLSRLPGVMVRLMIMGFATFLVVLAIDLACQRFSPRAGGRQSPP